MAIVEEWKEFEVEEHQVNFRLKKILIELAFVVYVVPIVGSCVALKSELKSKMDAMNSISQQ